jgi:hypothetical protein
VEGQENGLEEEQLPSITFHYDQRCHQHSELLEVIDAVQGDRQINETHVLGIIRDGLQQISSQYK